ncbi:MAG: hypothetical protein LKF06_07225 [Prevotella sp.]|nr:hypothetical protein [Prevotella sp.]
MSYRIRNFFSRVWRWKHIHGFGVQSPSAYHFIRYVVNETYPYYDYADLKIQFPKVDYRSRKLGKLYFRIANALQPGSWILDLSSSGIYGHYIHAGCLFTSVMTVDSKDELSVLLNQLQTFDVACLPLSEKYLLVYKELLRLSNQHSVLILEGIHGNRKNRHLWKQIISDPLPCVTYDLYDCGIIFFDHTKSKQNFIVDF